MSRSIRRVLFRAAVTSDAATVIHLRQPLPAASSVLPVCSGGPPSDAHCLDLLRVGFTEPTWSPRPLVVSYTTVSPLPRRLPGRSRVVHRGGLFSVALSRGSPRVAVGHHPALWSPDDPRQGRGPDATAWPTHPPTSIGAYAVCSVRAPAPSVAADSHDPTEGEHGDVVLAVRVGDRLGELGQHVVQVGQVVEGRELLVGGRLQALESDVDALATSFDEPIRVEKEHVTGTEGAVRCGTWHLAQTVDGRAVLGHEPRLAVPEEQGRRVPGDDEGEVVLG